MVRIVTTVLHTVKPDSKLNSLRALVSSISALSDRHHDEVTDLRLKLENLWN
jgi:hypothetical protein